MHDIVVTDDLANVLPFATVVDGSIAAPSGTSAALDVGAETLTWTVGAVPSGGSLTLTYQVIINPGAAGVSVGNVVSATGDVPPTTCAAPPVLVPAVADPAVADPAVAAFAAADSPAAALDAGPCSTVLTTTLAPTMTKESTGPAVWDPANGTWTVGYRLVATNPNPANDVPYTLADTLGFPAGTEILSAAVTLAPDGVTPASPSWDGVDASTIVENANLPAGATHTYELAVTARVPATTNAASLACAPDAGTAASGLFNEAALDSSGSVATDTACESMTTVLTVEKHWVINGVEYLEGSQPPGFVASLTLDGQPASWNTDYVGYPPGAAVEVGESAQVPSDCTSSSTGLGTVEVGTALVPVTVTNAVVCTGQGTVTPFPHCPTPGSP